MSERYTKVYECPQNVYSENSPVVISAGALLKDNQTGKILAQLKIRNITNKVIELSAEGCKSFTKEEYLKRYAEVDSKEALETLRIDFLGKKGKFSGINIIQNKIFSK